MLSSYSLLAAQILAHLALIPMILYGKPVHYLAAILVYFCSGCLGMTMTYHRLLSHRSWKAPRWFEYMGTLFATLGMTGSAISWVAVHRKHHRYTDEEKDPHSPAHKGFFYCQWLSMFTPVEIRYVPDLVKTPFYLFQHRYYFQINFVYALALWFIDPFALIYAWLVPSCILWNAGSSIVTLSHLFGANPHGLKCHARNNWLLALTVWGEGWHNNHHAHPAEPVFGRFLDLGGSLICLMDPQARTKTAPSKVPIPVESLK
jgi:stearoyl-CoA desaturase (delta-9 desaturase)